MLGYVLGERSVPQSERSYQHMIDGCHRYLEDPAFSFDHFGRCIAGAPQNSN